jgi:hypothetical protein
MVAAAAAGCQERITPMTENESTAYGMVPRMVQEFMDQLRATTGRLEDLARSSGGLAPAAGSLPLPGGLSAAQMTSITDSIAAQRRSISALQAQLSSFDEQLAVFEQILGPLAQWSKAWADLEQRMLNMGRQPGTEAEGSALEQRWRTSGLPSSPRPRRHDGTAGCSGKK